jgi:hypothetical protein
MRPTARVLALALVATATLAGCGKHYWNRPGAGAAEFAKDSSECARANALYMSANKEYGVVLEDGYRSCLRMRGWVRAQHHEPPPDWFRGIESNDPVRLDGPAPPPPPRSGTPAPHAEVGDLVGTWAGQLERPSVTGRAFFPATLRISENGSRLRGELEVSGIDLKGAGDIERSASTVGLVGRFGARALAISFTLIVSGTTLDATGLGADNTLYRLALKKR